MYSTSDGISNQIDLIAAPSVSSVWAVSTCGRRFARAVGAPIEINFRIYLDYVVNMYRCMCITLPPPINHTYTHYDRHPMAMVWPSYSPRISPCPTMDIGSRACARLTRTLSTPSSMLSRRPQSSSGVGFMSSQSRRKSTIQRPFARYP